MRARALAAALALAASTAACGESAIVAPLRYTDSPLAPEEAFRANAPLAARGATAVDLPWHLTTLPNGVRVAVLERHALPLARIELVLDRGAADLGVLPDAYGILARAFAEGTEARTVAQLADAWAAIGAAHSGSLGPDGGVLWATVGAADAGEAVALLAETALRPQLTAESFARVRSLWTRDVGNGRYNVGLILSRNTRALLFGPEHPYGYHHVPVNQTNALRVEDVAAIHRQMFQPAHATLIVAGDVDPAAVAALAARSLGAWTSRAAAPIPPVQTPPPEAPGPHVVHSERKDEAETQVSILVRGPGESSPDLAALSILASSFGGRSSRMRGDLREERGAAYLFGAGLHRYRTASYLQIQAALAAPKAMPALRAMLSMIAEVARGGLSEAELDRAKATLLSGFRARTSTTGGVASLAVDALTSARPIDEAGRFPARVQAVTLDEVRRVAAKYLAPGALRVVVVGSPGLRPELEQLGLGPAARRDEWGDPVVSR